MRRISPALARIASTALAGGEHHGIRKPSFVRDRLERYAAWYDRFVKAAPGAPAGSAAGGR